MNIYNGRKVGKTYITTDYDLCYGTIEDILGIIDIDKIDNDKEIIKMVLKAISKLKPFLMDIFEGLTEQEIKNTKIKELIMVFANVIMYSLNELKSISRIGGNNSKN